VGGLAYDLCGTAEGEASWRNLCSWGEEGARAEDRLFSYLDPIENHRAHSDQNAVLDDAAMQNHVMPHNDIGSDDGRPGVVGHMDRGVVLNVRAVANPNEVHVATQHGVEPNARVGSEHDVANDRGRWRHVNRGRHFGMDAVMGEDQHGSGRVILTEFSRRIVSNDGGVKVNTAPGRWTPKGSLPAERSFLFPGVSFRLLHERVQDFVDGLCVGMPSRR